MNLVAFGDYRFTQFNIQEEVGPQARADIYSTPLGGFDPNGSERATGKPQTLVKRCEINDTDRTSFQTALDEARALIGTREKLYAQTAGELEIRWVWARLASIGIQRSARNVNFQELIFSFNIPAAYWNGRGYADWTLDDTPQIYLDTGYYLDTGNWEGDLVSSPDTFTITNGGNRAVTNVILAIIAGSSNITFATVTIGGAALEWTGTLLAGNTLLIDSGSMRVLNNGADAYSGLVRGSGHSIDDWLRIEPGDNEMEISWTGGGTGSNWTMNFWDGWH